MGGVNINKSLMTLGSVIRKLVNDPDGHIPYRNSQLTRILPRSFGESQNINDMYYCTVTGTRSQEPPKFCCNANRVKTRPRSIEVDISMSIMGAHEAEMSKLRMQLKTLV